MIFVAVLVHFKKELTYRRRKKNLKIDRNLRDLSTDMADGMSMKTEYIWILLLQMRIF